LDFSVSSDTQLEHREWLLPKAEVASSFPFLGSFVAGALVVAGIAALVATNTSRREAAQTASGRTRMGIPWVEERDTVVVVQEPGLVEQEHPSNGFGYC
jgi:hypothetical protein